MGSLRPALRKRTGRSAVPCAPFLPPGETKEASRAGTAKAGSLPPTRRMEPIGNDSRLRRPQAVPLGRTRTNIADGNLLPIYRPISTQLTTALRPPGA